MENATKITCPACGATLLFAGRRGNSKDFIFRSKGEGGKIQTQAQCSACKRIYNYDLILVDNPREVTGNEIWKD